MPANAKLDQTRLARIAQWADEYVDSQRLPGASILIHHHGAEVFWHACGYRDLEAKRAFDRDTVVRLYSMTKPVTSLAIMQFVEQGELSLDTPLDHILPQFSEPKALRPGATSIEDTEPCAAPSIHQLLIHTAGFSYGFNEGILPAAMAKRRMMFGPKSGPLADVVDKVGELPLAFQPGTKWEYSIATDILGRVIEVLSGLSLADYFADQILNPLGMENTGFTARQDQRESFSNLYMPSDLTDGFSASRVRQPGLKRVEQASRSNYFDTETFSGGAGLVGTINDYAKFAECLRLRGQGPGRNERILSPRLVDYMMQNHLPGDISDFGPTSFAEEPTTGIGFGLGGGVVTNPARMQVPGSIGDFSWGGMASTFFWVDPMDQLSVVFFTQLTPSGAYPCRTQLKALVHAAFDS